MRKVPVFRGPTEIERRTKKRRMNEAVLLGFRFLFLCVPWGGAQEAMHKPRAIAHGSYIYATA